MFKELIEPFRHPSPELNLRAAKDSEGKKAKAKAKNWTVTLGRIWTYLAKHRGKLALVLVMEIGRASCRERVL